MNGVTLSEVKDRIMAACKKFGIDVSDGDSGSDSAAPSPWLPFVRSFPLEDISDPRRRRRAHRRRVRRRVRHPGADPRPGRRLHRGHRPGGVQPGDPADARPAGGRAELAVGVFYNHGMTITGTPSDRDSMPIGVPAGDQGRRARPVHPRPATTRASSPTRSSRRSARASCRRTRSPAGSTASAPADPPRGGFRRRTASGNLPTVRRTESTLREYGPDAVPRLRRRGDHRRPVGR